MSREHWQTLLARASCRGVRTRAADGPRGPRLRAHAWRAIEREAQAIDGPLIVVAHSGG